MSVARPPRTLLLCSRLPTFVQGGLDLRVRNQVLALSRLGPTAVFGLFGSGPSVSNDLSMWRRGSDESTAKGINPVELLSRMVMHGEGPYSFRFSSRTAGEMIEAIGEFEADVVVISRLELMPYLDAVESTRVPRIVLDLDETSGHASASIASIMQNRGHASFYRRFSGAVCDYEREMVGRVGEVWLSSTVEVERFRELYPVRKRLSHIPNVVDVEAYTAPAVERAPRTILFTGSFGYEPNLDAVRFITGELLPRLPDFRALLVGSGMPEWMTSLDGPQVETVGPVPDMAPFLASAEVAVIPLRAGGGTRLKAVEALAAGLPIVSTRFGVEGLGLVDGEHYLRAETPEEFADAITQLAGDRLLQSRLSCTGRQLAQDRFSLEALAAALRGALGPAA